MRYRSVLVVCMAATMVLFLLWFLAADGADSPVEDGAPESGHELYDQGEGPDSRPEHGGRIGTVEFEESEEIVAARVSVAARLSGRIVREDGSPVSGARVVLREFSDDETHSESSICATVRAGKDGRFAFNGLTPGFKSVQAGAFGADGSGLFGFKVFAVEDKTPLELGDIVIGGDGSDIRFELTDADGAPVKATVHLGLYAMPIDFGLMTNEDGKCRFKGIDRQEELYFSIRSNGLRPVFGRILDEAKRGLMIKALDESGRIKGSGEYVFFSDSKDLDISIKLVRPVSRKGTRVTLKLPERFENMVVAEFYRKRQNRVSRVEMTILSATQSIELLPGRYLVDVTAGHPSSEPRFGALLSSVDGYYRAWIDVNEDEYVIDLRFKKPVIVNGFLARNGQVLRRVQIARFALPEALQPTLAFTGISGDRGGFSLPVPPGPEVNLAVRDKGKGGGGQLYRRLVRLGGPAPGSSLDLGVIDL